MVVSEEVNPNHTTTENTEKGTSSLLKLDYSLMPDTISEDISLVKISSDDIVEEEKEDSSKTVTLLEEKGVESGIEIHYTSMKLRNFPIKESNISNHEKEVEQIGLSSSTVHIGDAILLNTAMRIISFNKFKLIEFKTREFKIALSIKLVNDTIVRDGDYFKYEIFSKIKNSRLASVVEIFKKIFSGAEISFNVKDLYGRIVFDNPIQLHKFGMISDIIEKYENIEKTIKVSKNKPLSETEMSFYSIYLLDSYLSGKNILNSWINYRIKNDCSIVSGDKIVFIKDHQLDFRGIGYNLREIIKVKDEISEREINSYNGFVVGYRKLVEIQLVEIKK